MISKSEVPFEAEDLLGFDTADLEQVTHALKKANHKSQISWIKLQKAFTKCGIPTDHIQDPNHSIGKLYSRLKSKKNPENYDSLKLIMLAVLLCRGSTDEKGKIIFHHFDTNDSQTLSASEVGSIMKLLGRIACKELPQYVLSHAQETHSSEVESLQSYISRLQKNRNQAKASLVSVLPKEPLTVEDFLKALRTTRLRNICFARNFRQFVAYPEAAEGTKE